MTPEREAQMRELYEKQFVNSASAIDRNEDGTYRNRFTQINWEGFRDCARALEPMVRDGGRYRFLRDEMELSVRDVFSSWCPQLNAGLDAAIDAAMSAALEDGNADV